MDPQVYVKQRIAETAPTMAWKPGGPGALADWQQKLGDELRKLLGGLTEGDLSAPLNARTLETRNFRGYRRETVTFTARSGLEVFAYFLTPDDCSSRRPAVLCLPGHGRGVDSIVGIAEDGSQRELGLPEEYQEDFALQCVSHGYPTLAIEQVSFGHRRDSKARDAGPSASSCTRDTVAAFMLGETMVGWRVLDALRSLDYLTSRPEVNPERLITMGISGGGVTSLWTACLDSRVYAAVVSGYFNTFRDSILAVDHCVDNYVPGVQNVVEMPDLAGLVAPRPLFVEGGIHDNIFPLPAFKAAVHRASEIYADTGASERFGWESFEGAHQFYGVGAFAFLQRMLVADR